MINWRDYNWFIELFNKILIYPKKMAFNLDIKCVSSIRDANGRRFLIRVKAFKVAKYLLKALFCNNVQFTTV